MTRTLRRHRPRVSGAALTALALLATCLVQLTPPAAPAVAAPGDGAITGVASGRCVDVPGAATTDGTALILWDCTGATNQIWTRQADTTIRNRGKCLAPASTTNGAAATITTCGTATNQRWTYDTTSQNPAQPGHRHLPRRQRRWHRQQHRCHPLALRHRHQPTVARRRRRLPTAARRRLQRHVHLHHRLHAVDRRTGRRAAHPAGRQRDDQRSGRHAHRRGHRHRVHPTNPGDQCEVRQQEPAGRGCGTPPERRHDHLRHGAQPRRWGLLPLRQRLADHHGVRHVRAGRPVLRHPAERAEPVRHAGHPRGVGLRVRERLGGPAGRVRQRLPGGHHSHHSGRRGQRVAGPADVRQRRRHP